MLTGQLRIFHKIHEGVNCRPRYGHHQSRIRNSSSANAASDLAWSRITRPTIALRSSVADLSAERNASNSASNFSRLRRMLSASIVAMVAFLQEGCIQLECG